ncbi:unnamed protein product, partial [Rotaria magnacalcarata]
FSVETEVELAPSDNPTTSTYFASMLHQPKEPQQQQPTLKTPNDKVLPVPKQRLYRPPLDSSA